MPNINDEERAKKLKRRRMNGIGAIGLSVIFFWFASMQDPKDIAERLGGLSVPVVFLALGIYFLATKPKENKTTTVNKGENLRIWLLIILIMVSCALLSNWIQGKENAQQEKIDKYIEQLKNENDTVSSNAVKSLIEIGEAAVAPLIEALKGDSNIRRTIVEVLAQIGKPAIEPLIEALKDKEGTMRANAAQALGKIGDKKAVEPLVKILNDQYWGARYSAADALGRIGDAKSVEPLIATLKDEVETVRFSAISALGKIGDKKVVEPLIEILKDESLLVRIEATRALGTIGDKRAVEPLKKLWKNDKDKLVQIKAAGSLAKRGDANAFDFLIKALEDKDLPIRRHTAEILGWVGNKKSY